MLLFRYSSLWGATNQDMTLNKAMAHEKYVRRVLGLQSIVSMSLARLLQVSSTHFLVEFPVNIHF